MMPLSLKNEEIFNLIRDGEDWFFYLCHGEYWTIEKQTGGIPSSHPGPATSGPKHTLF